MAEEKELTEEAKKQRRKREKAAAKDAALGVEKFTEVAGVFKPDLKRVMAAHGINNQQDIHQLLLINLIAADFETQATMLLNVTTPYEIPERCLEHFTRKAWPDLRPIQAMKS